MPQTEAQKRAKEKYRKQSTPQITVRFYPADAELWAHLQEQPNKQAYMRGLIRRDIESQRAQGES